MTVDPEALFVANQQRLFRYFRRAVGHADAARDLTQDVFLRVIRAAVPVASDVELRGWLFAIARNLALDHYRKRARQPEPVAAVEASRLASQDVDVAVNQALAALSDLDRDVFLMREVAGLGYEEIAAACGLTAGRRAVAHPPRSPAAARTAGGTHCDPTNDADAAIRPRAVSRAMSDTQDVISAFLDDEPFDSAQLAEALSQPDGREVLIDLIALRHLAQPDAGDTRATALPRRPEGSTWRAWAAAAAVLVALAGGYLTGARGWNARLADPPAATRVIESPAEWQDVPAGRLP